MGVESVFDKIMAVKLPNLKKETDIQVQEAWRIPNKMKPNKMRPTLSHAMKIN